MTPREVGVSLRRVAGSVHVSPCERTFLVALSHNVDGQGKARPKVSTLADRVGAGTRTIERGSSRLATRGWIVKRP